MTTSEKIILTEWVEREVQRRTNGYRRVKLDDTRGLHRAAGAVREAEKVARELKLLLKKL